MRFRSKKPDLAALPWPEVAAKFGIDVENEWQSRESMWWHSKIMTVVGMGFVIVFFGYQGINWYPVQNICLLATIILFFFNARLQWKIKMIDRQKYIPFKKFFFKDKY